MSYSNVNYYVKFFLSEILKCCRMIFFSVDNFLPTGYICKDAKISKDIYLLIVINNSVKYVYEKHCCFGRDHKTKKTVTFCDKNQLLLKIFFHLSILMKV